MGLGLFIVREIAKAHGGDVDARCDPQETTFTVRLPRKPPGRSTGRRVGA
jgi:signal transduction histidine kinase